VKLKLSFTAKEKATILDDIVNSTNENLLVEILYLAQGDDYDGGMTDNGQWKYEQMKEELASRLESCGFLDEKGVKLVLSEA